MSHHHFQKLDNPAWFSLTETHQQFAIGNDEIKCYQKNIAPFVSFHSDKKDFVLQLDEWTSAGDSFFIINDLPALPLNYSIENKLLCFQMICTAIISKPINIEIEKLGEADEQQMTSLIKLVQPGYYLPGTRLMGDYFGIRFNGQLVAITGERMRMNGLTEISAVVTHPEFTGRQYAQQLVAHTSNKNFTSGIIPFLHVAVTNERAVKLYEHSGFIKRKSIPFWKIKRNG